MIEVKTKLKRWGNSFGLVIPVKFIQSGELKEGEEVTALLNKKEKRNILRETFNTHKFKKPVEKLMKEMDEELDFG